MFVADSGFFVLAILNSEEEIFNVRGLRPFVSCFSFWFGWANLERCQTSGVKLSSGGTIREFGEIGWDA